MPRMEYNDEDPWCFSVLRSTGLQHLRPEKAWRPVITLQLEAEGPEDCDASSCHEITLGSDGQNPNQKEQCYIHTSRDATPRAKLAVRVWHKSQTKRKSKRKTLVAHSSIPFLELWKKHHSAGSAPVDIKLNALSNGKRNGKGSKVGLWPTLSIRIRPPSIAVVLEALASDEASTSSPSSTMPSTPPPELEKDKFEIIMPPLNENELSKRLQPYILDLDDTVVHTDCAPMNQVPPAVLPQYSERDPAEMGAMQRFVSTFTLYDELRSVVLEDQYEPIFRRQLSEWTYVGGCLIALASVDAAVFAISDDALFDITPVARSLIATSSSASGLGIVCTAWFILRYNFAPIPVIATRSRDLFDSYFFFSISARMPVVCMLISGAALMVFLVLVAWESWPEGVMLVSGFVGTMMTLQFLVYGAMKMALGVRWCARLIGLVWLFGKVWAGMTWMGRLGKGEAVEDKLETTES